MFIKIRKVHCYYQWRDFGLKVVPTKFKTPKAPRIETPKASREGVERCGNGRGNLGQWSNYITIYEGAVKYGERY